MEALHRASFFFVCLHWTLCRYDLFLIAMSDLNPINYRPILSFIYFQVIFYSFYFFFYFPFILYFVFFFFIRILFVRKAGFQNRQIV